MKLTATNNGYNATLTLTPGKQDIVANTTQVAYVLTLTAGSNYFSDWPIGWEFWLAAPVRRPAEIHKRRGDHYPGIRYDHGGA